MSRQLVSTMRFDVVQRAHTIFNDTMDGERMTTTERLGALLWCVAFTALGGGVVREELHVRLDQVLDATEKKPKEPARA